MDRNSGVGPIQNYPFELESTSVLYEIKEESGINHIFTRTDRVTPRHPARFYERRFNWTGTTTQWTTPEVSSSTDGVEHKVHGPLLNEGNDKLFLIDLGCYVAPNRAIEISTCQKLLDEGRSSRPHLQHAIRRSIGKIRLAVRLPHNLATNLRAVYASNSDGARHDFPDHASFKVDSDQLGAVLETAEPQVGFTYGIHWL